MFAIPFLSKKSPPPIPEPKENDPQTNDMLLSFGSLIYRSGSFDYYNPDDLLIKKGNDVYRKMMSDEQIKAVLAFKKAAIIARGWTFDIDADNPEQEKMADFFWHMIDQMTGSFTDKLKFILSGFQNGFSICEKIYRSINWNGSPYWGLDDIKLKPWDSFVFEVDEFGTLKSIKQSNLIYEEKIVPTDKVIHWVHQPDIDRWYGESDLRSAYRAWWSKDIVIRFQNIHLERHGSGFPVVTPEEKATKSDAVKTTILNILNRLSVRTGIYLPKFHKLEMFQPQSTDAYEKAVAQHDKSIAKAMLVPNLLGLSEQGQTGSYSQSQTQFDVFLWVIEDTCNSLAECLNEQLFADFALWNFGTTDFPKFKFDPLTATKKEELAKAWSELVQKGAVTNSDRDEAYTRSLLGYPEKEETEDDEGVDDDSILDAGGDNPDNEDPEKNLDDNGGADGNGGRPDSPIDEFTFIAAVGGPWLKRVRFSEIKRGMDRAEAAYGMQLASLMGRARLAIEKQIVTIAGDRSFGNIELKEFDSIQIPKTVLSAIRKLTRTELKSVFDENYNRAAAELPKKIMAAQIIGMDRTRADRFLASKSIKVTGIINDDVLKKTGQILENGVKYDKTLKQIMLELSTDTALTAMLPEVDAAGRVINVPARLENIVRTNVADAVNQSRTSLFGRPEFKGFIQAYEYSAILDQRVSDICETLNGRIRRDWAEYTPPNHFQCRSILVPVTVVDDWDGNESNIPASTKPLQGFA